MRRVACCVVAMLAVGLAAPAGADHLESHIGPSEPAHRDFPQRFTAPADAQAKPTTLTPGWDDPRVGGWGGDWTGAEPCPSGRTPRRPVVFVHGNTETAEFWRTAESGATIVNVRQRFLDAGWCADELWAISYTGGGGYFTYNDINVAEVHAFISEVVRYMREDLGRTDVTSVHVVAHSLGVTIVRKAIKLHGTEWLASLVAVAGANEGTTQCRGAGTLHVSHVCEEVEPGSAWLEDLNAPTQTPGDVGYLTILDGSGLVDTFYLGPDALSPELEGACNHHMPFVAHNTLARGLDAVERYRVWLADGTEPGCR